MDRVNHLTYIKRIGKNKHNKFIGLYLCSNCGSSCEARETEVRTNRKLHCGCLTRANLAKPKKHGYCNTKVYSTWKSMRSRCSNNNKTYHARHRYSERGIKVCPEWGDFLVFLADMGEPPTENHQLDRINNDGDYCKENCRWVTPKENCNNRKRYYNKTGYTGVTKNTHGSGYSAYMYINRKPKQIGTFATPEEAHEARVSYIIKYNEEHGTNLKY